MSRESRIEFTRWQRAEYPYDFAKCHTCATAHGHYSGKFCKDPHHAGIRKAAIRLGIDGDEIFAHPRRSRRLILAFRKKFARFYPKRNQREGEP